mmetsp:Transcript_6750/g.12307  ORF Transcript_6750/g.12307 Transcript_6750/m.12307 type:complete len:270 (-) Transcript_6750:49-858(-)
MICEISRMCLYSWSYVSNIDVSVRLLSSSGSIVGDTFSSPRNENNGLDHTKEASEHQQDGCLSIESILFKCTAFHFDCLKSDKKNHNDQTVVGKANARPTQSLEFVGSHPGAVSKIEQPSNRDEGPNVDKEDGTSSFILGITTFPFFSPNIPPWSSTLPFTSILLFSIVIVVVLLPELPPVSRAYVVSVFVVVVRIGVRVVVVIVIVIFVLVALLVLFPVPFLFVGKTRNGETKQWEEDRNETGHVPRQNERVGHQHSHISAESHFESL